MTARILWTHVGALAALLAAHVLLPAYHHGNLARIMVLAIYATGYNIAFGYTGLLSLGHALFFGAGLYAAGLTAYYTGLPGWLALLAGPVAGGAVALALGSFALRTAGVAFMIVTLMFAQAFHLAILYLGRWTRGDEGLVIARASRQLFGLDLADGSVRFLVAWALFALTMVAALIIARSGLGRVMVAMRENEERSRMLGYDPYMTKLIALGLSGAMSGLAGGAYALLFGYVGASLASVQYSILPLLYVLLGGAGTVLGPLIGTVAMFYLIDLASNVTDAHQLVTGAALVLLILFAPRGILGSIRDRFARWIP
ncbi:amino acid/amide ABC transporter membrane protein 2 (HAAT family) [Albidovulum inexpectatum]|uniref:Amino acid/amide ABC transporter membrane protein 2 (HAAT family) n=1 Tax=Albidovulum inexpectatum TaxID=196587 RepID=A0A2S5JLN9_9RHOB|nr:branched-chain amino acid ABC transporter permease [Albidovulum inexpectatum]PPB82318.1 amino acid/amide ABC transporter membrane protein 2 (HAAT family) [Albidovulum inexpectatum]